jgi:hypothetical protein
MHGWLVSATLSLHRQYLDTPSTYTNAHICARADTAHSMVRTSPFCPEAYVWPPVLYVLLHGPAALDSAISSVLLFWFQKKLSFASMHLLLLRMLMYARIDDAGSVRSSS